MDDTAAKIRPSFLNGMAYLAAFLAVMGLLAVLSFHFPEYLTTPRLREIYREEQIRTLLFTGLMLGSLLAIVALVYSRLKRLSLLALAILVVAWLAGGPNVPLDGPVRSPAFYISLDWLLLDLLLIATLFINVELFFRLKKDQGILRRDWQVDLAHYVANHMFNGLLVVALFVPAQALEKWLNLQEVQAFFSSLYLPLQVLLIMFFTDLAQYWVHRAFHQVPWLWRFHRIHHSVEVMDWLAGSRLHIFDVVVTRSISLVPMVLLGFSPEAINIYLPILALQSVFIHCNLQFEFAALQRIVTTPKYHHWHHTSDPGCIDRNFAISLPILDKIFGTYYSPPGAWPKQYGSSGPRIQPNYFSHFMAPFRKSS
jgi:sterol desaturase/sphingolipid hydroxylase (fatty acid hydroxylase superfamily)